MNTKSSTEVFPSCPAATTLGNIPEDVGGELRGIHLEAFLESLAEEGSCLPAQFLKFLLFGDTMGAVKNLSFLKWEGVDFDKKRMEITRRFSSGFSVLSVSKMNEAEETILCEMRVNRDRKSPWVFPDSQGSSVIEEARTVLRRVCRKANLKGVNFDVLKRSRVPISEMGLPTFPLRTKFRDLPQHVRSKAIAHIRSNKPSYQWPTNRESYCRGKEAAIKWVENVSLLYIEELIDESVSQPTYVAFDSEIFKELSNLCLSTTAYIVQDLLGLEEFPEATMANIHFEAGFHLTLKCLDEVLFDLIRRV